MSIFLTIVVLVVIVSAVVALGWMLVTNNYTKENTKKAHNVFQALLFFSIVITMVIVAFL